MERTYIVEKMMCNDCVRNINNALDKVEGISYSVDLASKSVVVNFQGEVNDALVIGAIGRAGYSAMRL